MRPRRGCAKSRASATRTVTEFKLIAAAASRIAKGAAEERTLLSSWNDVIDYCRTSMAFADKEQFRMLFLDKRNQLIADEVQQTGTVDHTPVYPREVIKRALELSATAIILVHNHPSGDPSPSQADIQMTKAIVDIAAARHRRARPHHRRQERACEFEGDEADVTPPVTAAASVSSDRQIFQARPRRRIPGVPRCPGSCRERRTHCGNVPGVDVNPQDDVAVCRDFALHFLGHLQPLFPVWRHLPPSSKISSSAG